jgi:large subunit ribosomal protein L7/L12
MSKTTLDNLLKKKEALEARIESLKAKERHQQRKDETRQKILLGAYIKQHQGEGIDWQEWLKKLDPFLERENDRKLFGLPVRSKEKEEAAN